MLRELRIARQQHMSRNLERKLHGSSKIEAQIRRIEGVKDQSVCLASRVSTTGKELALYGAVFPLRKGSSRKHCSVGHEVLS
jgi:hypothetical protein